jgi:hypothetical protein
MLIQRKGTSWHGCPLAVPLVIRHNTALCSLDMTSDDRQRQRVYSRKDGFLTCFLFYEIQTDPVSVSSQL